MWYLRKLKKVGMSTHGKCYQRVKLCKILRILLMGLARGTLKMIPIRMVFQINDGDKRSIKVQRRI